MNATSPQSPSHSPRALLWLSPLESYARCHKSWRSSPKGAVKTPERPGKTYSTDVIELDGIRSVWEALEDAQRQGDGFIIYGGLTPAGEDRVNRRVPIRRNKEDKPEQSANICEVPRHLMILDIDDVPIPADLNMDEGYNLRAAPARFLATLPDELKSATAVVQWTGSAGVMGWDTLKIRIFFWLHKPLLPSQMKAWLKFKKVPTDLAIYSPNQPIYVAAPSWDGVTPPLTNKERVMLLASTHEAVRIPEAEILLADSLESPSQARETKGPKSLKRATSAWRPTAYPHDQDELTLTGEAHLRQALSVLRSPSGSRHKAIRRAARKIVGPAVQAGHLSAELGRSVLLSAASRLGLREERCKQAESAINWGFSRAIPIAAPTSSEGLSCDLVES